MTHLTSQAARAAAMTNPKDGAAPDAMRRRAMFLTDPAQTTLPLSGDIGPGDLQIDYLKYDAVTAASAAPLFPAQNTAICCREPHGASCVRFGRVRLCRTSDDGCLKVRYQPLMSYMGINELKVDMPFFTAIAPLQTMGTPGDCS